MVTEKHIRDYIDFTKERGKYSYVSESRTLEFDNPQSRSDFGKDVSLTAINNLRCFLTFY